MALPKLSMEKFRLIKLCVNIVAAVLENVHSTQLKMGLMDIKSISVDAGERKFLREEHSAKFSPPKMKLWMLLKEQFFSSVTTDKKVSVSLRPLNESVLKLSKKL